MNQSIRFASSFYIILSFFLSNLNGQNTVGVIQAHDGIYPGYVFFSPSASTNAYLIDECGQLINKWERTSRPGLSAYFLDTGMMLRTYQVNPAGPFTSYSNAGGIELVDWGNNTVWSYEINTDTWLSHHDAKMMANGNILLLTWELTYREELVELGRDPNEIYVEGFMWSEKIIEIKPIGTNDMEIIWEWEIKDHYIQDFDSTKMNFGIVAEHPDRFDINLPELNSSNSNSSRDWNHFNAIDYNEDLDQILISARNSDEVWIIDHSTTTAEAATDSGGNYGKGGDILYRWGNANAYDQATVAEQQLFGQHGVNWITEGEQAGKIIIYNNGNGRPGPDFSTIEIIDPPQADPGFYDQSAGDGYAPVEANWKYDGNGDSFYSPYFSNTQYLENENILINAGSIGLIFEINSAQEVVWEYEIPLSQNFPVPQGSNPNGNGNFRAYKYALDFPGFDGLDLEAGEVIEIDPNPAPCNLTTNIQETVDLSQINYTYNHETLELHIHNPSGKNINFEIWSIDGKLFKQDQGQSIDETYSLYELEIGMYYLIIEAEGRYLKADPLVIIK